MADADTTSLFDVHKPHQYGRSQIRTGFVVRDDGPAAVPRALVWRCARGAERTLPWPGATPLKGGRGAEPADVISRSRGSAAGLGLAFAAAGACADALAGAPAFELVLACDLSPAFAGFGGAGFAAGALEDGGLDCGRSTLGGATAGSDGGARWIVTARLLLCRRYDRCRTPAAAWYSAPRELARVRVMRVRRARAGAHDVTRRHPRRVARPAGRREEWRGGRRAGG